MVVGVVAGPDEFLMRSTMTLPPHVVSQEPHREPKLGTASTRGTCCCCSWASLTSHKTTIQCSGFLRIKEQQGSLQFYCSSKDKKLADLVPSLFVHNTGYPINLMGQCVGIHVDASGATVHGSI